MAVAIGSGIALTNSGSLAQKVSCVRGKSLFVQILLIGSQPWLFWTNMPLCGIALSLIPITLEVPYKPPSNEREPKEVDRFGTIIFIALITGCLIPISWVE
jgi:hypothetical protein